MPSEITCAHCIVKTPENSYIYYFISSSFFWKKIDERKNDLMHLLKVIKVTLGNSI